MVYFAAGYKALEETGTKKRNATIKWSVGLTFLGLLALFNPLKSQLPLNEAEMEMCPMPPKYEVLELEKVDFILNDPVFRNVSAAKLGNALKVDTVVYDIMTMKDYAKFQKFHDYLKETFPLAHKFATVHKPNTYGLVFEFKGSNPDLKPIMLCAHQDTVPIGNPSDWIKDPWSGEFDDEKIYGRGSGDVKNLLIGLLESIELLLEDGKTDFERGVLLSFGFDEEKSGFDGARHIAEFLESHLGYDSVEFIIDEGPDMFIEQNGNYYGLIMSGEKGYLDLKAEINTPGGHSSVPMDHTSIGMLSFFLTNYESEMYSPVLENENPILRNYECAAEHGNLPKDLELAIKTATTNPKSKQYLIDYILKQGDLGLSYLLKTSQAIDIVIGGDKANALPRDVTAMINHRIIYGNDDVTIKNKAIKHAKATAYKFNIGLNAFGQEIIPETDTGNMVLSIFGEYLKPAPISPVGDETWDTIAGSMRAFYEDVVYPEKFFDGSKKYIVSPSLMTPNTDTRHYWNLTNHIYKSQPGISDLMKNGIHTHDEWIHIDTHLQVVAFYYDFISKYCGEK